MDQLQQIFKSIDKPIVTRQGLHNQKLVITIVGNASYAKILQKRATNGGRIDVNCK